MRRMSRSPRIINAGPEQKAEAMKRGAADFVTKPFELDALRLKVRDKLEKRELEDEVERLRDDLAAILHRALAADPDCFL